MNVFSSLTSFNFAHLENSIENILSQMIRTYWAPLHSSCWKLLPTTSLDLAINSCSHVYEISFVWIMLHISAIYLDFNCYWWISEFCCWSITFLYRISFSRPDVYFFSWFFFQKNQLCWIYSWLECGYLHGKSPFLNN